MGFLTFWKKENNVEKMLASITGELKADKEYFKEKYEEELKKNKEFIQEIEKLSKNIGILEEENKRLREKNEKINKKQETITKLTKTEKKVLECIEKGANDYDKLEKTTKLSKGSLRIQIMNLKKKGYASEFNK